VIPKLLLENPRLTPSKVSTLSVKLYISAAPVHHSVDMVLTTDEKLEVLKGMRQARLQLVTRVEEPIGPFTINQGTSTPDISPPITRTYFPHIRCRCEHQFSPMSAS